MLNTKRDFENVGRGIAIASGWVTIKNRKYWVSITASSIGLGKKRNWDMCLTLNGDGANTISFSFSKKDCFRYEAVEAALTDISSVL